MLFAQLYPWLAGNEGDQPDDFNEENDLDEDLIDDEELDERAIEKRNDIAAYYSEVIEESDSE